MRSAEARHRQAGGARDCRDLPDRCAFVEQPFDSLRGRRRISLDLEVPQSKNHPALRYEFAIDSAVACLVTSDLRIPVGATAPLPVSAGVAVPERSVDEHGHMCAAECEVGLSGEVRAVAPPTAHPERVQRAAEQQFGSGVASADACHDPAADVWAVRIWQGLLLVGLDRPGLAREVLQAVRRERFEALRLNEERRPQTLRDDALGDESG